MLRPTLRFCLESPLLESAEAGQHNFVNLMASVAEKAEFRVEFGPMESIKNDGKNAFIMTHMKHPPSERGLVFRRVYHYPFWQIENTAERWEWDTAKTAFDSADIPKKEAVRFAGFWRKRLFDGACEATNRTGYTYVPLQGRITQHRSFQSCSPIEMLQQTLIHADGRKVIATLHPKEDYSGGDLYVLEQLEGSFPNLEISIGDMVRHLQHCDFVVTQNSSVAFDACFFGKPALLFARIDFHHIAVQADMTDLSCSFHTVARHAPDYDAYIWWFWQKMSINAGREDAADKITNRFRRFGWPM